jgi:predicted Zn-dependent protease
MVVHSRPEQAIAHLERALKSDPSSAEANLAIGQALVQAKRPREAIPRLRDALRAGVRESLAGYDLARALSAAGDRAGALQTLQAIRPESPSDVESWNALGQLALQLESPSLAAAFFNGAVSAAPRSAQARRDLGVALMQMGRLGEAVAQLERAAALDPADPATERYLARARRLLKGLQ